MTLAQRPQMYLFYEENRHLIPFYTGTNAGPLETPIEGYTTWPEFIEGKSNAEVVAAFYPPGQRSHRARNGEIREIAYCIPTAFLEQNVEIPYIFRHPILAHYSNIYEKNQVIAFDRNTNTYYLIFPEEQVNEMLASKVKDIQESPWRTTDESGDTITLNFELFNRFHLADGRLARNVDQNIPHTNLDDNRQLSFSHNFNAEIHQRAHVEGLHRTEITERLRRGITRFIDENRDSIEIGVTLINPDGTAKQALLDKFDEVLQAPPEVVDAREFARIEIEATRTLEDEGGPGYLPTIVFPEGDMIMTTLDNDPVGVGGEYRRRMFLWPASSYVEEPSAEVSLRERTIPATQVAQTSMRQSKPWNNADERDAWHVIQWQLFPGERNRRNVFMVYEAMRWAVTTIEERRLYLDVASNTIKEAIDNAQTLDSISRITEAGKAFLRDWTLGKTALNTPFPEFGSSDTPTDNTQGDS